MELLYTASRRNSQKLQDNITTKPQNLVMYDFLEKLEKKYIELEQQLCDNSILSDEKKYRSVVIELSRLKPTVELYRKLKKLSSEKEKNQKLLLEEKDEQMRELIEGEIKNLIEQTARIEREIKLSLIPPDKNDGKNIIVEIRAGTGGDEATIFAADIFRMYCRFATTKNFDIEVLSSSPSEYNGFKEVIFLVKGKDAWRYFQFESGVHRVQRVPITESSGRIHTSAVSVAILVEAEEVEVQIDEKDLRIDTYRSSGAGGQHVNKTESAVRITHLPTGIVVTCQESRSQIKNKEAAMKLLRARLLDTLKHAHQSEIDALRRKQIGSGDRSEKIRTYNFPQNRVTDHRINYSIYNLSEFMEGNIQELIEKLLEESQRKKLGSLSLQL